MIAQTLLPEFDQEMAATRRLLECVPEDKTDWRPHPKSWTMGSLSLHVANIPSWIASTLAQSELDFNPVDGPKWVSPKFESARATVAYFDATTKAARAALAAATDEVMLGSWSLKNAGQTLFTMPRTAVLRMFVMNHLVHHRGQLTVYLRMCDVPLPKTYGPTADVPF